MASNAIKISWDALESINDSMHGAARENNWFDVLELASRRHDLLQEHFNRYPVGPDNADFYRQRMDYLLRGERELQDTVRNARKALMSEGITSKRNYAAVGAYLKSSSS